MVALKIPTVRNFFCYFELTTGGLILGWFDATLYGSTLLLLILNLLTGMRIFTTEELNQFTVLGLVVDVVVQLVVLFLLFIISVFFIRGIKERSAKKCLPFVILTGLQSAVFVLEGLVFVQAHWLGIAGFKIYFFIVVYSLYQVFTYGDEQSAYEAHQNANSAGYEQYYEPEDRRSENTEMGYQTTEFKGP